MASALPELRARAAGSGKGGGARASSLAAGAISRNTGLADRKLWAILRSKRLRGHTFRRQQPMEGFSADFICPAAKLVVVNDGSQHAEGDARATANLEKQGFRILRLRNTDILTNPDGVATAILAALEPPQPDPSDSEGRAQNGAKDG